MVFIVNLFSCTLSETTVSSIKSEATVSSTFTAVTALQLVAEGKLQSAKGFGGGTIHYPTLAAEAPWWTPGQGHGYEAITYGWLVGELLRRADGRGPGLLGAIAVVPGYVSYENSIKWWGPRLASWGFVVARPLGLDFHVGLADEEFYRVAHIARSKANAALDNIADDTVGSIDPKRLGAIGWSGGGGALKLATERSTVRAILTSTNKPEWRRFDKFLCACEDDRIAETKKYANAFYKNADMLEELTREHSIGPDKTLLTQTRFGLGCLDQPQAGVKIHFEEYLDQTHGFINLTPVSHKARANLIQMPNATFGLGPRAFGHPGAGGSVGFADPEHDVAFGFVTNTLGPYVVEFKSRHPSFYAYKDGLVLTGNDVDYVTDYYATKHAVHLDDPRAQKLVGILAGCL
uniref:Lipase n=1 Tax=Micrococcus sp. HL-2003 TaxID=247272 RepID=Q6WV14_9MICC|nr:lipase [Micrococcus sp. HL-2003]